MKKRLVLAGCITAIVVIFVARLLVSEWIRHTWGIEQSLRVMEFADAAISFVMPLTFYVVYRWGPKSETMSPAERRAYKRFYIPCSISFCAMGLGSLIWGLHHISVLPLDLAFGISRGMNCLALLPLLVAGILYLRDPSMGKAKQQQADRPGV